MVISGDAQSTIDALHARIAELTRSETRLRAALDNSTDMVIFLEVGGDWSANNTATRRLGYDPEYHPPHPIEVVHPNDREMTLNALRTVLDGQWDETQPLIARLRHADGHYGHYELRGRSILAPESPRAAVITARGVDAEYAARAETRMQQAQRLESLHRLGAGVAHDFCNLVGAVANHLTVIERHADLDDHALGSLAAAREALDIAGELSRRLLQFGDTRERATTPVDLVEILESVDALVRRALSENIDVRYRLPETPVIVPAARGEWEQIVLNLVLNASEAMPEGGTVHVGLDLHDDMVELWVTDSGRGMPAHVIARAFDPFFTTKAITNATGLGLSTVFSFAQAAGGDVEIESQTGVGTTVRVRWPRADE